MELIDKVVSKHLSLRSWGSSIVPWNVWVHALVPIIESHGASKVACSPTSATRKSLLVSGEKPLSLLDLAHEFTFGASVILVDIEEVMDGLAIFLVELGTESGQNCFKLSDVDILIIVDIARPEQLLVSDFSVR